MLLAKWVAVFSVVLIIVGNFITSFLIYLPPSPEDWELYWGVFGLGWNLSLVINIVGILGLLYSLYRYNKIKSAMRDRYITKRYVGKGYTQAKMAICSHCKASISGVGEFCPQCGEKLEE
jgi:hypothetical protein